MTALWQDGIRVPVTVLHVSCGGKHTPVTLGAECCAVQLDDVQVLSSSVHPATDKEEGRRSVVLGCSSRKAKNTNQALLGQFRKAGVEPKLKVAEFVVSEDAVVPPGERSTSNCATVTHSAMLTLGRSRDGYLGGTFRTRAARGRTSRIVSGYYAIESTPLAE